MSKLNFINWNDDREYLLLPFVPTESDQSLDRQWVEMNPPGVAGGFQQFTGGGQTKLNWEIFLNDIMPRSQDKIQGNYVLNDMDTLVNNVRTALEWFDILSNARYDIDGVYTPPPPLMITVLDYPVGIYVITRLSVRTQVRHANSSGSASTSAYNYMFNEAVTRGLLSMSSEQYIVAGSAARATVQLELTAYSDIPVVRHPNMSW